MQKMYKTLDDFIAYMYDKRAGSEATSDSYYRDVARFIEYLEENKKHPEIYALKIDISKFFYSIDHEILKKMLKISIKVLQIIKLYIIIPNIK